jgi:hypothetical protein
VPQYHNNTHVPVVETRVRYLSCDFPLSFKSWLYKSASRDRHKTPYWLLLRSIIAAIVPSAFAPSRLSFSSHNTTVILDKACIVPEGHYYCTTLIPSYLQTQERGECLADRPHDSDPSQTLMRRTTDTRHKHPLQSIGCETAVRAAACGCTVVGCLSRFRSMQQYGRIDAGTEIEMQDG